jgi:hypothetical protein
MAKKYTVEVPEYYTVKHYKEFDKFAHLEETEQMLAMVSVLTDNTLEEIREWPIQLIVKVYNELNTMISAGGNEFYPVIEWKDVQYGFQPMHKMTTGEYVDVDTLAKDVKGNLNTLLAILYRPITRNKLDSNKFAIKTAYKAYNGKVENPFDYYDIEEYDTERRNELAKEMEEFPIDVALGAIGFFLDSNMQVLKSTQIYFPDYTTTMETMKKEMKSKTKYRLASTMVGSIRSTSLQKPRSYQ